MASNGDGYASTKIVLEPIGLAIWRLRNLTQIKAEPEAGTIRIIVRQSDAHLAAAFANSISQALIERQIVLSGKPGTLEFFEDQKVQSQHTLQKAAAKLSEFASRSNIYSAEAQKQLLLGRLNDAESRSASTINEISQKTGEKQALTDELRQLRPVTQSAYITGLVERFGSSERDTARQGRITGEDRVNTDNPPLLMVRVYQDAMVELLKLNSQLSGLQNLQVDQQKGIGSIRRDLQVLSQNEAEFNRLKSDLAIATFNADTTAKRAVEERIAAEMEKSKLSPIQVAQAAIVPLNPAFPSLKLFTIIGVVLGAILSLIAALATHLISSYYLAKTVRPGRGQHLHKEPSLAEFS